MQGLLSVLFASTSLAVEFYLGFCSKSGTSVARLAMLLVASACLSMVGRRLMTIEWAIGWYNINIQRFEHDMVSVRSTWQGRHGAWLIDTPPRMVSLTTDSLQCKATITIPLWPSDSESVLWVRLRVTVICILALPHVTLGITAEEVNRCSYSCHCV